tara:strand:- start:5582 stop:5875 length:294 start_codon:yes stop_codon:yes gene_type:complete
MKRGLIILSVLILLLSFSLVLAVGSSVERKFYITDEEVEAKDVPLKLEKEKTPLEGIGNLIAVLLIILVIVRLLRYLKPKKSSRKRPKSKKKKKSKK